MAKRCVWVVVLGLATALPAAPAQAATVLQVGPAARYRTIQAALNAARLLADAVEVRVQQGLYPENLTLGDCCNISVSLSGGWDAAFMSQVTDPHRTIVDGRSLDRTFSTHFLNRGVLRISNLELTRGLVTADLGFLSLGGALLVEANGTGAFEVHGVYFTNSRSESPSEAEGAGASIWTMGGSRALVEDAIFSGNVASSPLRPHGAGLEIAAYDTSRVDILRGHAYYNTAQGGHTPEGAGLRVTSFNSARVRVEQGTYFGNRFAMDEDSGNGAGAGVEVIASGSSRFDFHRNRVLWNQSSHAGDAQLNLVAWLGAQVFASDSVVAGSPIAGVAGGATDNAHTYLTNLTVADNTGGYGIHAMSDGGTATTIYNCIVYRNLFDLLLERGSYADFNLVGPDPLFVNAATWDYRLQAASPARDFGTPFPPGGLGRFDMAGAPRWRGAAPDAGAYELLP